jgi:uncharacterized protein YcfL
MKKLLFVFPVIALLAAGCSSSQQTSIQTPAPAPVVQNTNPVSNSTPTQSTAITAPSTIQDLNNILVKQGLTVDNKTPGDMWWMDASGIAVNVHTTNSLNFNITNSATQVYTPDTMSNDPNIAKTMTSIGGYMNFHFASQVNQSTTKTNSNIENGVYTQAFYNSTNLVRCRLEISSDAGAGSIAPFNFSGTVLCADNGQYQAAYNLQAPYLKALASNLTPNHITVFDNASDGLEGTCSKDSSVTIIKLKDLLGGSDYYAMRKTDTGWINTGWTGYQISTNCR